MQHKVKVEVIDKKLYPELQKQFCADPNSGACPCYQIGDTFIFERYGNADDFWHMGVNTLKQSKNTTAMTAGGSNFPHCSEAWDAISRYIYTGLQGGAIMRGWMKDERVMITCCSDGTRPVIFKIERMDYKVVYVEGIKCDSCRENIKKELLNSKEIIDVVFQKNFIEVLIEKEISNDLIKNTIESCGNYIVTKID